MILLFLGSWRSTVIIAISIPLSILTSVIVLSLIGETINTMTLGGLALAVGILVDDATVTIENIERFLENGYELREAILDGAAQIAVPALVSTLCICIVFLPMFFLEGVCALSLRAPGRGSHVRHDRLLYSFAHAGTHHRHVLASPQGARRNPQSVGTFSSAASKPVSSGCAVRIRSCSHGWFSRASSLCRHFSGFASAGSYCCRFSGRTSFPARTPANSFFTCARKTGTRIEETARLADQVEASIRSKIPGKEVNNILDNLGLPYSPYNTMHLTSGIVGAEDGDILVSLNEDHHPTANYVRQLRKELPREFPGTEFYFLPADITTQILNFGLPAPIDIQFQSDDVAAGTPASDGHAR